MSEKRRILVTSALPYANGSIHLGHLLEHIQTDIWTRFQRLRGNECYSVCADDAHGTPVMLKAQELGITPEEMVARTRAEHHQDLLDFHVNYDNYYVTHSPENKALCEEIYTRLDNAGYISKRTINQVGMQAMEVVRVAEVLLGMGMWGGRYRCNACFLPGQRRHRGSRTLLGSTKR